MDYFCFVAIQTPLLHTPVLLLLLRVNCMNSAQTSQIAASFTWFKSQKVLNIDTQERCRGSGGEGVTWPRTKMVKEADEENVVRPRKALYGRRKV